MGLGENSGDCRFRREVGAHRARRLGAWNPGRRAAVLEPGPLGAGPSAAVHQALPPLAAFQTLRGHGAKKSVRTCPRAALLASSGGRFLPANRWSLKGQGAEVQRLLGVPIRATRVGSTDSITSGHRHGSDAAGKAAGRLQFGWKFLGCLLKALGGGRGGEKRSEWWSWAEK